MNLLKRGNTYHFRIRIPSDLTPEFSRKEIQQSLKRTTSALLGLELYGYLVY